MDKLKEAKDLSAKAENFMKEGNETFAIHCYDKIIALLKQSLVQATSQESINAIKDKMTKFVERKAAASARLADKDKAKMKITTLGFPSNNQNQNGNRVQTLQQGTPSYIKPGFELKKYADN
jgi:hypothetical protein